MSGLPQDGTDRSHRARVGRYGAVSTALALLSDHQLGRLLDAAPAVGSGVGGSSALLDVAGTLVFVKRIPLTDLERDPDNVMSTANLFGVPTPCHYGVVQWGGAADRRACRHRPCRRLLGRIGGGAAAAARRATPYPAQQVEQAMSWS